MSRCPFCGERYIGNRFGVGAHLSSVAVGILSGLIVGFTALLLSYR